MGFLLIAITSGLFVHIQLKMNRAGYKTSYSFFGKLFSANGWDTPAKYLKVREQHGWSPWPVYLLFPFAILGVLLLFLGVIQFLG